MSELDKTATDNKWDFWIDRGGTFTDIVARRPDGRVVSHKLLSENPGQYRDAAIQGVRDLLGISGNRTVSSDHIAAVKMGTTVATNALLERRGERLLLLTTTGFADALRIGTQNRPRLFDRHIVLPEMAYEQVAEITARISRDGEILSPLDRSEVRSVLQKSYDTGIRAVAMLFMHSYRFPDHETEAAEIARDIGFTQISVSHRISPLMKLIGRGNTTVVDAYLSPILRRYVDQVAGELGDTKLLFMQSHGGLTSADRFQGKDAILSGPAGGVVGAVEVSRLAGFDHVIGFDMGGTSTDVCHYARPAEETVGKSTGYERVFETEVAGVRLRAPMMNIHTVAAGGGSILKFDGARFRVGPQSAGADPGPACYRRGGPLTVTDANVMLGKLQPDMFPHLFGTTADQPIDQQVVTQKFNDMVAPTSLPSPHHIADGFIAVAVENMAQAIKKISVERGYNVTQYVLTSFGGAGGQHACLVADALGIGTILLHPLAGVLSALGMGLADLRTIKEISVEAELSADLAPRLEELFSELTEQAKAELIDQNVEAGAINVERRAAIRYLGTDTPLVVAADNLTKLRSAFEQAHRQRFGFISPDKPLVVGSLEVEAAGGGSDAAIKYGDAGEQQHRTRDARFFSQGAWHEAPVIQRAHMHSGDLICGPAIIYEAHGTNIIEPGWQAEMTARQDLILTRITKSARRGDLSDRKADPVKLEIFNNLFMSIAEQMGTTLENTAHSVNIKERLDFSCALFDGAGDLVANAPHIPVHLGSMSESVKAVIEASKNGPPPKPGDVTMLNDPYHGGTHLPDITVITPVFLDQTEPLFYVASRGHHADIGGITPGSMPPDSSDISQEGILIDNFALVREGQFRESEVIRLLTSGKYPARNPQQNIADLKAQIAANEKGIQELAKMVDNFGLGVVRAYMGHVQDNAEAAVLDLLANLQDGENMQLMDDGGKIAVKVTINHPDPARAHASPQAPPRAVIDFTGTSAQRSSNFNAPLAVCKAAVLYVFRCLIDDNIPLNAGCMKPLDLIVPQGCMLNPMPPAAVVAGNVETSQVIVDALFAAFGALAGSQGTMNNLTFGNDQHQYYETICGGAGAGPGFDGASAVQTHMTNSRLTDPEVLEWRFPVRVEEFAIRQNSGGQGQYKGGDGVTRRLQFLEPMTATILANHRTLAPSGLAGGGDGDRGRNLVERSDGRVEELPSCASIAMTAGDCLIIETPGGGGFGHKTPQKGDGFGHKTPQKGDGFGHKTKQDTDI